MFAASKNCRVAKATAVVRLQANSVSSKSLVNDVDSASGGVATWLAIESVVITTAICKRYFLAWRSWYKNGVNDTVKSAPCPNQVRALVDGHRAMRLKGAVVVIKYPRGTFLRERSSPRRRGFDRTRLTIGHKIGQV